jgi:hypothetical protein
MIFLFLLCRRALYFCLHIPIMPNLRHLRVQAYYPIGSKQSIEVDELDRFSNESPHLETLILPKCVVKDCTRDYEVDILVDALAKWSKLTTLSLDHSYITNALLKRLLENTPNVKDLSVAGCPDIEGAVLVQFAKSRMNKVTNQCGLQRLDISGCFQVRRWRSLGVYYCF